MTGKRYFVTCEVGNAICDLISRELSDDEFEHLTYHDIVDRLNQLAQENEQLKSYIRTLGIGISKIMQSIKNDREEKALIMCLELLKKLEEEGLLE